MRGILPIVEQVVMHELLKRGTPLSNEGKVGNAMVAISTLLLSLGAATLVLAAYIWLSSHFDTLTVALSMGGLFIILGLVVMAAACFYAYMRKRKILEIKSVIEETFSDFVNYLDTHFSDIVARNPKTAFMAAVLSGYVLKEKVL